MSSAQQGSLVVVGTGINALQHCSLETIAHIRQADQVFALVTDGLCLSWLRELNPRVTDLQPHYQLRNAGDGGDDLGRSRAETYAAIVATLVNATLAGQHVVAVFYGHPGVFVNPSHEAIQQLRTRGYAAQMLPGISAEDCLFADLGVDPCQMGCAQYEATAFLFYHTPLNTAAGLILWQLGVLGDHTLRQLRPVSDALPLLVERLRRDYPADHPVTVYEAASLPVGHTRIETVALADLVRVKMSLASTLYVPPTRTAEPDPEFIHRLGLSVAQATHVERSVATTEGS